MCGIAGVLNLERRLSAVEMRLLATAMADRLSHRGPDDADVWSDEAGFCALAHRRLSIIGPGPMGRQPMLTPDGRAAITYNGELYNFPELRDQLAAAGELFRTRTDTEVFLAGLRRQGPWFLTLADAMFGLGFYDGDSRTLILGRDPFGEKPLYYTQQGGLFAFASELQCLTLLPGFDAGITPDAIASYLAFQVVPAPETIYRSCRKLAPGHFLRVGPQGAGPQTRYFRFVAGGTGETAARGLDEQADEVEEALVRALAGRLISDVPLGAFLSGGVDSSTAVALIARRFNRTVKTFSIGFSDTAETEHQQARAVAEHLGTDHTERILEPASLGGILDLATRLDEPNVDSSCLPTFEVSRLARQSVTVAITGDGGDEMFGGYGRYAQVAADAADRHVDIAARRWHVGRQYYSGHALVYADRELTDLFGDIPSDTADRLLSLRRMIDLDPRPIIHRLRETDMTTYLPVVLQKVDRMSMLNGLECRTPYLSLPVAAVAARLPAAALFDHGVSKRVLKRVAERYLPTDLVHRPKMGFMLPVARHWSRQRIHDALTGRLRDSSCRLAGLIDRERLLRHVERGPDALSLYQMWGLLILEIWLGSHPFSAAPAGGEPSALSHPPL